MTSRKGRAKACDGVGSKPLNGFGGGELVLAVSVDILLILENFIYNLSRKVICVCICRYCRRESVEERDSAWDFSEGAFQQPPFRCQKVNDRPLKAKSEVTIGFRGLLLSCLYHHIRFHIYFRFECL